MEEGGKRMKKIEWYQYFGIGAYVAGWLANASQRQAGEEKPVITKAEQQELANGLIMMISQMINQDIEL
jgi:hypothetical protein